MEGFATAASVGAAGVGAAAKTAWDYNRSNYMYDRTMKQTADLRVYDFRNNQASQWREDVSDITGLTSQKMSTYLVIGTVLFGAGITQMTNGALELNVAPWVSNYYMISLASLYAYLFLSIWFAMHASNIAQSSAVRLRTQFVRLPVPTWEELHESRTYGSSWEGMETGSMFRVPFFGNPRHVAEHVASASDEAGSSSGSAHVFADSAGSRRKSLMQNFHSKRNATCDFSRVFDIKRPTLDPWSLEHHKGVDEENYELWPVPVCLRRHIRLARRAAMQYQCFDAFARVSMTFAINQFVHCIVYFSLGKIAFSGGAHTAAWCTNVFMLVVAHYLIKLDFQVGKYEESLVVIVQCSGSILAAVAVFLWATDVESKAIMYLVPMSYLFNGTWMLLALHICGISRQDNGALLPLRMRATMYLDVFGWLRKLKPGAGKRSSWADFSPLPDHPEAAGGRQYTHAEVNDFERQHSEPTDSFDRQYSADVSGGNSPNRPLYRSKSEAFCSKPGVWKAKSAAGPMPATPAAFGTWEDDEFAREHEDATEYEQPARIPASVFMSITRVIALVWFAAAVSYLMHWQHLRLPLGKKDFPHFAFN